MTDARRRELELVADLVLSKADLKVTKEVGSVKEEIRIETQSVRDELQTIPLLIDEKIHAYDEQQTRRRQWTARTMLIIAGLALTAMSLLLVKCSGG